MTNESGLREKIEQTIEKLILDVALIDHGSTVAERVSASQVAARMRDPAVTELLALISPAGEVSGWQPIETAPRDGTMILGHAENEQTVVYWSTPCDYWTLAVCGSYASDGEWWPTHWMPLPAAPRGMEG